MDNDELQNTKCSSQHQFTLSSQETLEKSLIPFLQKNFHTLPVPWKCSFLQNGDATFSKNVCTPKWLKSPDANTVKGSRYQDTGNNHPNDTKSCCLCPILSCPCGLYSSTPSAPLSYNRQCCSKKQPAPKGQAVSTDQDLRHTCRQQGYGFHPST